MNRDRYAHNSLLHVVGLAELLHHAHDDVAERRERAAEELAEVLRAPADACEDLGHEARAQLL